MPEGITPATFPSSVGPTKTGDEATSHLPLWRNSVAYLILLLLLFPIADLLFLIVIAGWIGSVWTLVEIFVAGLIGMGVLRSWGFTDVHDIEERLAAGWTPQEIILDRVLLGAAGMLLLTPGMIGDAIGLLLLIPPLRRAFGGLVWSLLGSYLKTNAVFHVSTGEPSQFVDEEGGTIDSYVVRRHEDEEKKNEPPRLEP